jgi:hypothetical protein
MRPLSGGFFGTISGFPPPQYRFSDDGKFVDIAGMIQTPIATGTYNAIAVYTMPPAYRTINPQSRWLVTSVADGAATPVLQLHADGTLQFHFLPASLVQTIIGVAGRYTLDDQNGFIQT